MVGKNIPFPSTKYVTNQIKSKRFKKMNSLSPSPGEKQKLHIQRQIWAIFHCTASGKCSFNFSKWCRCLCLTRLLNLQRQDQQQKKEQEVHLPNPHDHEESSIDHARFTSFLHNQDNSSRVTPWKWNPDNHGNSSSEPYLASYFTYYVQMLVKSFVCHVRNINLLNNNIILLTELIRALLKYCISLLLVAADSRIMKHFQAVICISGD